MKPANKNIIISEGRRPLWQIVLAATFFTAALFCFFYGHWGIVFVLIVNGIKFSVVTNIHFDIENRQYKKEYAAGLIRFGKWKHLPNIEYVCVFRQAWTQDRDQDGVIDGAGYRYDVNIWHDISKHFTIYTHPEKEPAYEMAKHLALQLGVDFLDASDPHNKEWVELYTEYSSIPETL